jgi:ribokinase
MVGLKTSPKQSIKNKRQRKKTIQPIKAQAVNTIGAGDAFNTGFLYGLIHDKTLAECGQLSNFVRQIRL